MQTRPALLSAARAGLGPGLFARRAGAPRAPAGHRRVRAYSSASEQRQPRKENVAGDIYVDHTCIDCDTCRWMAPSVFARVGDMSAVVKQPEGEEERQEALRALVSCPTFSIHARSRGKGELATARDSLPLLVPGCAAVYHTGFHAENSYGATPYLILRSSQGEGPTGSSAAGAGQGATGGGTCPCGSLSGGGNILVDVPRWNPALAKRLEALGGVRWIFLTHEDDVGDHAAWAAHFGATRIIHRRAVSRRQGTDAAEWQLEGEGPWELGPDVQLLYTPGHTAGCVSLLYKPDRALLTGDHLAWSARLGRLTIFRAYNWGSIPQQLDSVHSLLSHDFLHVLPGHGRRRSFQSIEERDREVQWLLEAEGWRGQQQGSLGTA